MSKSMTSLRVFIASPSGLDEERHAFREEIREANESDAEARGFAFSAVCWEMATGGLGRPQEIINEDVRSSDYLVLVLWDRWGSAPSAGVSEFSSGTEEEYCVALKGNAETKMPREILILFKTVSSRQIYDPGPQLEKVLEFRKKVELDKAHLFHTFETTEDFRRVIRRHLSAWLRAEEVGCREGNTTPDRVVDRNANAYAATGEAVRAEDVEERWALEKAWSLAEQGQLTEAEIAFAKSAFGRYRPESFIDYGRFLLRVGRLDQAKLILEESIGVAIRQKELAALGRAYGNLGVVMQARGDGNRAEEMYGKALEIGEQLGRPEITAGSYGSLASILSERGELPAAEKMYRRSLDAYASLGDSEGAAATYGNLGHVLQLQGDSSSAAQMYRVALDVAERVGSQEVVAGVSRNLGSLFHLQGMWDKAKEMYEESLRIAERLANWELISAACMCLGHLATDQQDRSGSMRMYRKSLEIEERLLRPRGMADAYLCVGNALMAIDRDGAERMYRKSLKSAERMDYPEGVAVASGALASICMFRNDPAGAEELFKRSLELGKKHGFLAVLATNYSNLGVLRQKRGDVAGAMGMLRQALAYAEQLGATSTIANVKRIMRAFDEESSTES